MKISIQVNPLAIQYLIRRRYDEAADGCGCYECMLLRALVEGVLMLEETEEELQ